MSKFIIQYEVDSTDLAAATAFAHEVLYMANLDVDRVTIQASDGSGPKHGMAFGERGRVSHINNVADPNTQFEVNPSVAQKIYNSRLPDDYTI